MWPFWWRKIKSCDMCRISYIEVRYGLFGLYRKPAKGGLFIKSKEGKYYVEIKTRLHCAACLMEKHVFLNQEVKFPNECIDKEAHKMYHVTGCGCPCQKE